MEEPNTVTDVVKIAFAAVNFLVWTGLFLYLLRLARKLRELEAVHPPESEGTP